jgi:hypothetical protein
MLMGYQLFDLVLGHKVERCNELSVLYVSFDN